MFKHGSFKGKAIRPEKQKSPMESGGGQMKPSKSSDNAEHIVEHGQPEVKHMSETHNTKPHPVTGVHGVAIHHMGEGKAMTHTHHDGGHIESKEHATLGQAHQEAQQQLPDDQADNDQDDNADGAMPEMASDSGDMGSLGSLG